MYSVISENAQVVKPAVEAWRLSKTYENGTQALIGVDFRVRADEFVVILGPSGAGKSTFLRSMNRLIEPTGGRIKLMDEDITHVGGCRLRQIRARVGMIFQQFNLVRRLSVLENVLAGRLSHYCCSPLLQGLSLLRIFSSTERDIAFDCLRKVHIENLAFQRADTLSGGQQQRVAIARTLAQEPDVILADEPVASLDPASAEIVMQTLLDIHEMQRIPVVVNLHQIELGRRYGKRIVGMRAGRIVFDGLSEELDHQILRQIYGQELESGLGKLRARAGASGAPRAPVPFRPALSAVE